MAVNTGQSVTPYTPNWIENQSFDPEFQVGVQEPLLYAPSATAGGQASLKRWATGTLTRRFDYDGANNLVYYGEAANGAATSVNVWRVRKLSYDGSNNVTAIQWSGGTDGFNQVWDDRASLSYS